LLGLGLLELGLLGLLGLSDLFTRIIRVNYRGEAMLQRWECEEEDPRLRFLGSLDLL
jgi:hypothetical protein